jgi:hypothetical protein
LLGNPVEGAMIALETPPGGDVKYMSKSAKDGSFVLYDYFIPSIVKRRLCITGPEPSGAAMLAHPPFDDTPPWFALRNVGMEITSKLNSKVDVGKISPQVLYSRIKVFLRDREDKPLIKDKQAWQEVWFRIRDNYDNVIITTTISSKSIDKAVDVDSSAITIALPEGIWKIEASPYLEASPSLDKGIWIKSEDTVSVKADEPPVSLYLRCHLDKCLN